jgi:hypothetical protein
VAGKAIDGLNTLNSLMPKWYEQNQEATLIGVNYADVFENMAEVINKGIALKDGKVIAVPPELISAALAMEQGATEDSNPSDALTTLIDAAKADGSLEEALNVRIKLSRANNSKAVQPQGAANLKKAVKQK